jgi:hypothetical protein
LAAVVSLLAVDIKRATGTWTEGKGQAWCFLDGQQMRATTKKYIAGNRSYCITLVFFKSYPF